MKDETCGFKCTGYDGSDIWNKRMEITKQISCETCKDHAIHDESGLHDHVSAGLGKPVYDKENYNRFVDEVICVRNACKKDGRC